MLYNQDVRLKLFRYKNSNLFQYNQINIVFKQYAVAKYPLLDIIAQPQRQLHCQVNFNIKIHQHYKRFQVTEDKSQPVSHTLRFHGNQYDGDTLKANDTPLQTLVKLPVLLL